MKGLATMGASVTLLALHEGADFSSPTLPDSDFATMLSFRGDNTGRRLPPAGCRERRWHNAQDGAKVGLLNPQDGATLLGNEVPGQPPPIGLL